MPTVPIGTEDAPSVGALGPDERRRGVEEREHLVGRGPRRHVLAAHDHESCGTGQRCRYGRRGPNEIAGGEPAEQALPTEADGRRWVAAREHRPILANLGGDRHEEHAVEARGPATRERRERKLIGRRVQDVPDVVEHGA